jgi:hypothetical protein
LALFEARRVWAPSDAVLAQVAFSRIRTFDSSQTPARPERLATSGGLAAVDLAAIMAALTGSAADAAHDCDVLTPAWRSQCQAWNAASSSAMPNSRRRWRDWPCLRRERGRSQTLLHS